MNKETNHPLILVFYLEKEAMSNQLMIKPFVESINQMIYEKKANVMAFFIPTNGNPRVECINPSIVSEADMSKINKMVEDIKKSFSIGEDINIEDDDIEMTDEEIVKEIAKMTDILNEKPCDCGNNPNGNCKCDE